MGFSKFLDRLRKDDSGNALILVAMGMPVLIGSSGAAIDVAQWYTWKRELQYAADQAALAGAWASAEPEQAANYITLANLEFSNNLSTLNGKVGDPIVQYQDWNGGTDNTVLARSGYTEKLPFTSIFWKGQASVNVSAQASFQAATNYTTCLLALDPEADDAFVIGGSVAGTVTCGVGALSNSVSAIRKNGNSNINVSDLISAGGIDEGLAVNGQIHEYISNLSDPFDGATPPESSEPRSYSCDTSGSTTTGGSNADVKTRTIVRYTYYQGSNLKSANTEVTYTGADAATDTDNTVTALQVRFDDWTPAEGYNEEISDTGEVPTTRSWPSTAHKKKSIYEFSQTIITKSYVNVNPDAGGATPTAGTASGLLPGTYSEDVLIACDTTFNPGVYIFEGTLDFGQNHVVQGNNVLFVFTGDGAEQWKINSKSVINFTGITYDQLRFDYLVPEEDAKILDGMIVYDPNSTEDIRINGGADILFDGVLYMPKRSAKFNGNSSVAGTCLMLAAGTIELTGSNAINSLCIPEEMNSFEIGGTTISVRLIA